LQYTLPSSTIQFALTIESVSGEPRSEMTEAESRYIADF
jgi:hypothetical protein